MSDIDWNRAKELLARALELEGDARREYLESLHNEDETIGRELQTLVTAHEQAEGEGFLDGLGEFTAADAMEAAREATAMEAGPREPPPGDSDPSIARASDLTLVETRADDPAGSNKPADTISLSGDIALPDGPGGTLPAGQVPPSPKASSPKASPTESTPKAPPRNSTGSLASASPQRIADDFEVLEELGVGGMGVVYRAWQHSLRRNVALKIIPTRMLRSTEQVARFYLEAEAAGRLDHPGIVPVQSVGEHDGVHYYAMALVEGGSLASYVTKPGARPKERLSARRAAEVMQHVCRAVQYAHDRAVIHRDIKPANILLDKEGRPRLTDFGLAKVTDDDDGLTVTGQVMGTPSYMAPEQAEGKNQAISTRTDVYSLGATLYALLAGRPPFTADTLFGTLRKVQNEAPAPLGSKAPIDLATICAKGMAKRPEDRYPSADAMAGDLRRYLDGYPISARRLSVPQRAARWARRNPTLALLIGAVAGALLVGTVVSTLFAVRAGSESVAKSAALAEAQANAERLSDAIEETFIFASEDLLADEPGMQAARQRLLEIAQRYYRQLADSGYGDDRKLAAAAFMLGRVQASLGRTDAAAKSFDRAQRRQLAEVEARPGVVGPLVELAQTHNEFARLGKSRWHEGQIDRPTTATRQGLLLWRRNAEACVKWRAEAARLAPEDGELQRLHANALMNLALVKIEEAVADPIDAAGDGDTGVATDGIESLLTRSQAIRREALDREPGNGRLLRDTALGLSAESDLRELEALRMPDAASAEPLWRESLRLTNESARLLAELPKETRSIETDYRLATRHQRAGRLNYQLGEVDQAIAAFGQMRGVMQELLRQNPRVGRFRTGVAEALFNLSMLAYASDDLDGGAARLADCQDTLIDGIALHPTGESLGLLVDHTQAIAEALALNDRVPQNVRADLLKRATGLIERADEMLASLRLPPPHEDNLEAARQRLQSTAEKLARQVKPDRGA
ncbi:MAG: serine/threonine-protein kinase [Planctomycetota bacterium]